jgi:hypothetical protein
MPVIQRSSMTPRPILPVVGLLVAVLLAVAWSPARRHYRAAHLLATLATPPASSSAAPFVEPQLEETELDVPRGDRQIRSRVYRIADGVGRPGVVVAHGVHYRGIDERRLVPFARALAREGLVVLTPELRELADYRISEESERDIGQATRFLSSRSDLVDSPRVGLLEHRFLGAKGKRSLAPPPT